MTPLILITDTNPHSQSSFKALFINDVTIDIPPQHSVSSSSRCCGTSNMQLYKTIAEYFLNRASLQVNHRLKSNHGNERKILFFNQSLIFKKICLLEIWGNVLPNQRFVFVIICYKIA